ncbi:MAG: glycosyltransferase family A protein [Patescibacteria group bacterium]
MKNKLLVSIVIPTKNSAAFLEGCLKSIKNQTYKNIEIIVVDNNSTDETKEIANKYRAKIYDYSPKVKKGTFDAPHKRNYGVKKAKGEFVYYLDADMELSKNVVEEALSLCKTGCAAVIAPEESFGKGVWASAKNLERQCYWGDDSVEAPRFFKKSIWKRVGGLDKSLGGGGDDWDLYQKLLINGYKVARTKSVVGHNEGNLKLTKLIKKRFMYGKDSLKYISKRPKEGLISYFPVRRAYIKNWRLFASRPKDTILFIIMRSSEYVAGAAGIIYSLINK